METFRFEINFGMNDSFYSIITGTGRYIPTQIVENKKFMDNEFFNSSGEKISRSNDEIISKFQQITEIEERRYVEDQFVTSDIGFFAAKEAISISGIDKETLDYIIVAHNFGDVKKANQKSDFVPTIASRIKFKLGINNPYCVAYDIPFGCPGWVQAMIQADYYIKSGDAKKVLVIGAETLSRVSDPHDIDSMIYSDGAGAAVVESVKSSEPVGILAHKTRSDTINHSGLLRMEKSYNPGFQNNDIFLKMDGRKLYEYVLNTVPQVLKDCIDRVGLTLSNIKKVIIHQANAKMDDAILFRLFKLYNIKDIPKHIMPMTIAWLGNNSVATIPILLDLLIRGEMENQQLAKGDHCIFASVGAGMNVNVIVYRMP
jgi:3-oxoacyl-[acyl-carrier-protein] synthase III